MNVVKERVSIVTPVFNGAAHLPDMLDSVLCQTYEQVEMILVDDGSTDETVKVAGQYRQRFADRGYSYRIVQVSHQNASAAISQGLPFVTGEYLIWPDSDDILEPDSIRQRVAFLREHPRYQCVRSLPYYADARTRTPARPEEQMGNPEKEDLFWDILESSTYVCCGCYMLRSEPFFEIYPDRHIPVFDVGQNFQMLLPFMYRHRCPTIQKPLYGVLVRENSHSRRNLSRAEEEKKYRDYEQLVDVIAQLCQISDRPSRKRFLVWKVRRRYQLALKYGCKIRGVRAIFRLYRLGIFSAGQMMRKSMRLCLGDGRIASVLTVWYHRIF